MSELSALLLDRPAISRAWRVTAARAALLLLFSVSVLWWDTEFRALLAACAVGAAALDYAGATRTQGTGVSRPLLAGALFGLLAGALALTNTGHLAYAAAAWLLALGLTEVIAAARVRRPVPGAHEWLLGVAGWGQTVIGLLLLMFPAVGPRALEVLVAMATGWAGLTYVMFALRLRACLARGR